MLGRVLVGRMPGVGLSAEGRAQAARLAEGLSERAVAAVVSSPVQRALETAAPIAAHRGAPFAVDAGLDEIDFGAWTGREFGKLEGDPAWHAWNAHRGTARCPGGESMAEAQTRAVAALQKLARDHPEGEVVAVGHQDVLKALVAWALNLPLDYLHRFAWGPGHRSVLSVGQGWATVEALNLPPG